MDTNAAKAALAAATPNVFNRKASADTSFLGPLQPLVTGNQWVGDTGFNLMVVPNPAMGFLVMVSPLFETHIFEEVPAPVPNRTMNNGTEKNGAVKYSQIVAENVSKNILHEETGMWLWQTPGSGPPDSVFGLGMVDGNQPDGQPAVNLVNTNSILRSGTIPHGNTVHATGPWANTPINPPSSGNIQPFIEVSNFQNAGGNLNFLPVLNDGTTPPALEQAYTDQITTSLANIGRNDLKFSQFIDPIGFLNSQANNLLSVTSLPVTTNNGDGGGVLSIPFETTFARPTQFICTFLIETVANLGFNSTTQGGQDENPNFFQLQYLQSIPILIPGAFEGQDVLFPHWNLNTLIAI